MRHGRENCLYNKQGCVHLRLHKAKQSQAEHVDKGKTLPGGRAATMFFFSSKPSDAVLAVKHSCTQSDNNVLSAVAARKDCVWQIGWAIWPGYINKSITSFHCHLFVAKMNLILCQESIIESHVRQATQVTHYVFINGENVDPGSVCFFLPSLGT